MYIRLKILVYYTVIVFGLFKEKFNKHKALLNLKGLIHLCTPNLVRQYLVFTLNYMAYKSTNSYAQIAK